MTKPTSPANPFRPGFGVSPAIVASRLDAVSRFEAALQEDIGNPYRTILISGPRGIGKTVLLNELEDCAQTQGWVVLRAHPHDLIEGLTKTQIPNLINQVSQKSGKSRHISHVSIAGIGALSTTTDVERIPEPTVNTELRVLASLLTPTSGVIISIDEIQSADPHDLWQLATAIQDLMRDNLPIGFIADGLPEGINHLLDQDGTTFLRRATRIELKAIGPAETTALLNDTARLGHVTFDDSALKTATTLTRGYPYFVQLLGSLLWARVQDKGHTTITEDDVYAVSPQALARLGQLVHAPAIRNLPQRELEYLEAMARLQEDLSPVSSIAIAESLTSTTKNLSMIRQRLLSRDLIYSPRRGELNFTIPHLGHYLTMSAVTPTEWD